MTHKATVQSKPALAKEGDGDEDLSWPANSHGTHRLSAGFSSAGYWLILAGDLQLEAI